METRRAASLDFLFSARAGGNQWLHHPRVIDAWKRGAQLDVPPLTLEFAPILSCDAGCPLCPYGRARNTLGAGARMTSPVPCDDRHAASWEMTRMVLKASRNSGVEAVLFTGGGEPDLWRYLPDALSYAADLGMNTCLYTNGARLGVDYGAATTLLERDNRLAFIRVSLNAVSKSVAKRHWGPNFDVNQQFEGLERLLTARNLLAARCSGTDRVIPAIQVSTIIDHQNLIDLPAICNRVVEIFIGYAEHHDSNDVMIVRPLVVHGRPHGFSSTDHTEETIRHIIALTGEETTLEGDLAKAGVKLFLGYGLNDIKAGRVENYASLIDDEFAWRSKNPVNLANGIFLTVGPSGHVYPGTEFNCNDRWTIGSLREQTIDAIYRSPRRAEVLANLNQKAWQASVAQPFSRTNRLARIAAAISTGAVDDERLERLRSETSGSGRGILLD